MSGATWTPEEMDILRQMAEAGATVREVGRVLKSRTLPGIRCKAEEMGIQHLFGPRPEVDFEAFQQFLKARKVVKP